MMRLRTDNEPEMPAVNTVDERLLRKRLQRMTDDSSTPDMIAVLGAFAELARLHGALYLERYLPLIRDQLLQLLLQQLTDGVDAEIIRQTADNYVIAAMQRRRTHLEIIRQGVAHISAGGSPQLLADLLYARLGGRPVAGSEPGALTAGLPQAEVDVLLEAIRNGASASDLESGAFELMVRGLENRALQKVMRELPREDLSLALTVTTRETLDKVFANLSPRARRSCYEAMRAQYHAPAHAVAAAKQRMLDLIRAMETAGAIIVRPARPLRRRARPPAESASG